MKQFIVDRHTTPNTPTLEQVPTEKIPVYNDLDAVTADLANLSDGQIGTTKDTGSELSAPVDTVQSGNMHAVTSNAVAESLSYSTTEQKIGGLWINGKPRYKKVFYSATNWANDTVVGSIQNHDFIINIINISTNDQGNTYQNAGVNGNDYSMATVKANGDVVAQRNGSFVNNNPSAIIVVYTKTTD